MPQLVHMRQRIRAIETIKKITNAMRLISMSSHLQLSRKAPFIQNYKKELFNTLDVFLSLEKKWQGILNPNTETKKTLIILVSSQKGLCGTFNNTLFNLFEKKVTKEELKSADFISVGKKATDYLKKENLNLIAYFDQFTFNSLSKITNNLFEVIAKASPVYTDVICYSNNSKSFFAQVPERYILIPAQSEEFKSEQEYIKINYQDYIWEQPANDVVDMLTKEYLKFAIQSILFNSIFAEQAARFQSMDSATRNADELLEDMKRKYNKLRQSKITKEITELSSSM